MQTRPEPTPEQLAGAKRVIEEREARCARLMERYAKIERERLRKILSRVR